MSVDKKKTNKKNSFEFFNDADSSLGILSEQNMELPDRLHGESVLALHSLNEYETDITSLASRLLRPSEVSNASQALLRKRLFATDQQPNSAGISVNQHEELGIREAQTPPARQFDDETFVVHSRPEIRPGPSSRRDTENAISAEMTPPLRNKRIMRRSLSALTAEHFEKVKKNLLDSWQNTSLKKTQSMQELILENKKDRRFMKTPTINKMTGKLNDWLERKRHSVGDFQNLKYFGKHSHTKPATVDHENNEIPQVIVTTENATTTDYENINLEAVAKDALQDVHMLILKGYPLEQCECWLRLIKQKYIQVEEDPYYWECRAALEQSRGDINLAVNCYKTAIIQGAKVDAVDQLLEKFNLLDINSKEANFEYLKDRAEIVQDAKNIFNSTIIKFAVQERSFKKSKEVVIGKELQERSFKKSKEVVIGKELVVTPVRRSTRSSRSAYTSSPGMKLYSSLKEVDDKISFKRNEALN